MAGEALGTATLILDADDRLLTTKLDGIQKKATQTGASLNDALSSGLGTALPGQLGGLTSALAAGTGAAAAIGVAVAAVGVTAVSAANDLDRLTKQMEFLTGSAEQTQTVISNLKRFALESPFELPELTQTAKQLLGYGLAAKEATDFTIRLGNISAVTGGSLGALAENFAKAQSAGKVGIVDLAQFSNAGLAIADVNKALTELYGKGFKELARESGGAFISVEKFNAALVKVTSEGGKFYEGAVKGATDLDKQWATLKDTFTQALVPLGQVLLPPIIELINQAIVITEGWSIAIQGVKKFYEELPGPIKAAVDLIGKVATFNPAVAIAKGIGAGGAAAAPTAIRDTPADLARKEEAAQRIRDTNAAKEIANQQAIAAARSKANDAVIDATNELATAERLLGLEGKSLKIAEAKLEIDKARAAEAKAIAEYDAALQGAGFDESAPKVIEAAAALDAAGINVQTAMLTSADAIKQAGKEAEENFKNASDRVKSAERALFSVLTDEAQGELLKEAAADIEKALLTGRVSLGRVVDELGASINAFGKLDISFVDPQALLSFADKAKELTSSRGELERAAIEANKTLTRSVNDLAQKNWQIYIKVQGQDAVVQGAMLGGVN